jgi:hypothetical protein
MDGSERYTPPALIKNAGSEPTDQRHEDLRIHDWRIQIIVI